LDHAWVQEHPEYYVHGTDEQLLHEPQNYVRMNCGSNSRVLAYGRDPYFSGWPDTLQLNYAEPTLQDAMRQQLKKVAAKCDGVRCDMAMLVLPNVFGRTAYEHDGDELFSSGDLHRNAGAGISRF